MNIVDIEKALIRISEKPYDPIGLGLEFVSAFAKSPTTAKRLKNNSTNTSDIKNGLLWRGFLHYAPALQGKASEVLGVLKDSKASKKHKVRLLIVCDGHELQVFDRKHNDLLVTSLNPKEIAQKPEFFFPLAGLESFRPDQESIIDIKATAKLAKLYDALIEFNKNWEKHRHELNHFMTQIIFCLFAEDAEIFPKDSFTKTLTNRAGKFGEGVNEVITKMFTVLNVKEKERTGVEKWVKELPYVNGGLFANKVYVPKFNKKAFEYLMDAASIDWSKVNPDILGSSIQAIVEPSMRGNLGMHYTSIENIMKTLSPLFLDELREQLFKARYNKKKISEFLKRLFNLKVFDPACGSGNFLVIAYRELRKLEIEALDALRDLEGSASMTLGFATHIRLSQFYGIEYADFAAETAKLALWIAEHQANIRFKATFGITVPTLPLKDSGNIFCENALIVNWKEFCPIDNSEVKVCGNPPYLGSTWMDSKQKEDLKQTVAGRVKAYKLLDYVCSWFFKGFDYCQGNNAEFAFVATNSIVQGTHVPLIWPVLLNGGMEIGFAHRSFRWRNNAANNAGVTCVIIGMRTKSKSSKYIFENNESKVVSNINGYLLDAGNIIVNKSSVPLNKLPPMSYGNKPVDGGNLILDEKEAMHLKRDYPDSKKFIRKLVGSQELIKGIVRYCLWINNQDLEKAKEIPSILERIKKCKKMRLSSRDSGANKLANFAHQFRDFKSGKHIIVVPRVTSENREYLPVDFLSNNEIILDSAFAIYDESIAYLALIASRLHLLWIATVCGKLKTDFRYSNTLGWHTFPVPSLNKANMEKLEKSAKEIILAREEHYPATLAEMYDPEKMPENLRKAHRENDELIESLYRTKPFKDDQDRLEHLFKMYSEMIDKIRGNKCR